MTRSDAFALLCRLALAAVFVAAACAKIADPAAFALAVSRYHILPGALINVAAIGLPWVELFAGLALLLPAATPALRRFRLGALLVVAAMLATFTVAIAHLLLQGQTASCGCFSTRADASSSNAFNIVRNVLLLAAAAFAAAADARRAATRPRLEVPR